MTRRFGTHLQKLSREICAMHKSLNCWIEPSMKGPWHSSELFTMQWLKLPCDTEGERWRESEMPVLRPGGLDL